MSQDIGFIFTTIERFDAAQRCIASIRKVFPDSAIYVGDQCDETPEKATFYSQSGVNAYFLGSDKGLSFGRNFLLEKVREPYILLCDDDFIFQDADGILNALEILKFDKTVGILGGQVIDVELGRNEEIIRPRARNYEHKLFYAPDIRTLVLLPLRFFQPETRYYKHHRYLMCDMVLNFALIRRSIFANTSIRWNDAIKIAGEHEDFYLRTLGQKDFQIGYYPDMKVFHHRLIHSTYQNLRYRTEGLKLLSEEWKIDRIVEVGKGVRILDSSGALQSFSSRVSLHQRIWAKSKKLLRLMTSF